MEMLRTVLFLIQMAAGAAVLIISRKERKWSHEKEGIRQAD